LLLKDLAALRKAVEFSTNNCLHEVTYCCE
jgi:hypothetical protein